MRAGNLHAVGFPAAVKLRKEDSTSIAFVDIDFKNAADEASVSQPLALGIMRQKFKRQGYLHFVVLQFHSKPQKYVYAAKEPFAKKVQEILLAVQASQRQGKTWTGTSLGKLLHPKKGDLIEIQTMLRGNHVRDAIEEARIALGDCRREGNTAAGIGTPVGKQREVVNARDKPGRVQRQLNFSESRPPETGAEQLRACSSVKPSEFAAC